MVKVEFTSGNPISGSKVMPPILSVFSSSSRHDASINVTKVKDTHAAPKRNLFIKRGSVPLVYGLIEFGKRRSLDATSLPGRFLLGKKTSAEPRSCCSAKHLRVLKGISESLPYRGPAQARDLFDDAPITCGVCSPLSDGNSPKTTKQKSAVKKPAQERGFLQHIPTRCELLLFGNHILRSRGLNPGSWLIDLAAFDNRISGLIC
jgi:hypothetical protein